MKFSPVFRASLVNSLSLKLIDAAALISRRPVSSVYEIPAENVGLYFREFKPLLGKCKFGASCTHTSEPGCKILEAVYSGVISEDRYESFKNITEEIKTGDWRD